MPRETCTAIAHIAVVLFVFIFRVIVVDGVRERRLVVDHWAALHAAVALGRHADVRLLAASAWVRAVSRLSRWPEPVLLPSW